jgi:hypothetical protein
LTAHKTNQAKIIDYAFTYQFDGDD